MNKKLNLLFIFFALSIVGLFIIGFYPTPPNIKKLDQLKLNQFKNALISSNFNIKGLDGEQYFESTHIDILVSPDISEENVMEIFNKAVSLINNDKYYNHNKYALIRIRGIKDCLYEFKLEKSDLIFNKWQVGKTQGVNGKDIMSNSEVITNGNSS